MVINFTIIYRRATAGYCAKMLEDKSDDEKTIYTQEGTPIKWIERTYDMYFNKTALVLGGSESGKTVMLEEAINLLKEYIPNFIVVAPSTSRAAYKKKLPARCIKEDLSRRAWMALWERQVSVTQIFNIANDPEVLNSVGLKYGTKEIRVQVEAIIARGKGCIEAIQASNYDFAQKKAQVVKVEEIMKKRTREIYKVFIRENGAYLQKQDLNDKEKIAVVYVDLDPNLCLVIDDCSEMIESWIKLFKKGEFNPIKAIFFKGRWQNITLLFGAHDDKFFPTEIRKNAHTIIFCRSDTLVSAVGKAGSGYSKAQKRLAEEMAGRIFDDEHSKVKTHKKFIFCRAARPEFRYSIANLYPETRLGCDALRALSKIMPTAETGLENNRYFQAIASPGKNKKRGGIKQRDKRPVKTRPRGARRF